MRSVCRPERTSICAFTSNITQGFLFEFRNHGLNVDAHGFFNATDEAQLDPLMNDKRVLGGKYQRISKPRTYQSVLLFLIGFIISFSDMY